MAVVVEAVCVSSADARVAKLPRSEIHVGRFGVDGDRHAGEQRYSVSQRRLVPNNRQWSAVSTDEVEAFRRPLEVMSFRPGAMGENIRLAGVVLGDLARARCSSSRAVAGFRSKSRSTPA